jgi:rfaE bifunctional protein kinase chain/domain
MSPAESERLLSLVDAFSRQKVVTFGDMVLDEFLYGRIDRVSREAPVLILEYERMDQVPGGGGNAAANAASLGGTVFPVGLVGQDPAGETLRAWFEDRDMDVSGLIADSSVDTPTKTRVLAGSSTSVQQQVVRIDRNRRRNLDGASGLLRCLQEHLKGASVLLVSDYGHGTVDPQALCRVRRECCPSGVVTLVDSRSRLLHFAGMTAATPNLEEAVGALGHEVPDEDAAVARAAEELRAKLQVEHLAITRGSRGMTITGPDLEPAHLPVFGTDQVADVTGAGDTVIAAFSLALAAGANTREAATLANIAAGLAVLKRGTATVSQHALRGSVEDLSRGC